MLKQIFRMNPSMQSSCLSFIITKRVNAFLVIVTISKTIRNGSMRTYMRLGMHQYGRTGYQSDWVSVRLGIQSDWVPVRLGTQSDWVSSPTGYPVRLGDRSDWVPVRLGTQSDWVSSPTGYRSDWVPSPTGYPVRLVPSPTGSPLLINI